MHEACGECGKFEDGILGQVFAMAAILE